MPDKRRKRGSRISDQGTNRAPREAPPDAATTSMSTSTHDRGWEEVGGGNKHHAGAKQQQQQQQQRPSSKPQTKPAIIPAGARREGMGDSSIISTSSSSSSSRRQPPARSASSRREYTLFDHLLATSAPPPRRSGANLSLDAGGGRTPKRNARTRDGTSTAAAAVSQQPPPTRGKGASKAPPPAAPPGGPCKDPQRRPASQQARRGAPGSGDRGRGAAAQHVLLGAGSVALMGGGGGGRGGSGGSIGSEGGRFKKTGPSPSGLGRQKGGHVPPNSRAAVRNNDAPKPGKQRLGPRKKKLSSLKKKILLDRLEKWREIQENEGPSLAPADGAGEQGACPPSLLSRLEEEEGSASRLPPGGITCAGGIDDRSGGGGGEGGGGGQRRLWVVAIYNLVDEEDVEDDDDHAEIERDLWEMASTFGAVRAVEVPRGASHSDGSVRGRPAAAAKVAFASAEEAQRAKRGFHGRVVGGKSLRVEIENTGNFSGDDTFDSGGCTEAAATAVWRVAVEHLIDEEDDLGDEDEYAELCADISAMMGVHGTLVEVDIPRGRRGESAKGIDGHADDGTAASTAAAAEYAVVVTYGSQAEAETCVEETNGRRVGGKELTATLLVGQPRVGLEPSGDTKPPRDDAPATSTVAGCEGAATRAGAATAMPPSADADTTTTAGGGGTTYTDAWRVVIRNLIDEDDLIDDDDYGEVCSDATALVGAYGVVTRLCIPRDWKAAGEEGADTCGGAEPGQAVAVFGSPEEAQACARGLSGRQIAGKIMDAQVSKEQRPSQPGVEAGAAGAGPGNDGPILKQQPAGGTPAQSGRPSAAPGLHRSGSGVVRGVEPPAAGAGAGAQPSEGVAAPASIEGGKRMPTKYKEAAALPKPPGVGGGGGSPNAYVNQSPDKEVDDLVFEMLQLLFKFQERARLADPAKSKTRRRIVMGLREVLRGVKAKKVRLLIVAPNVDAVGGEGGLDEKVVEIIGAAREGEMPVVFALSKRRIGKALGKTIKVSAVGVYSFDGAHEQQKQLKRRLDAINSLPQPAPLGGDPI